MLIDRLFQPDQLTAAFQPIVDVSGDPRLYALECLTRGAKGTHFESADVMFEYVRYKAAEPRVDRVCVAVALEAARRLPRSVGLSVNVHAATLARDPAFPAALAEMLMTTGTSPQRLTVEITEHSAPWVTPPFYRALVEMRQLGIRIALDDVGIGHSNFKMMLEVRPDVLKLDRLFVSGIRGHAYRQAILECLLRLAARVGADVVAEGVGDDADLEGVRALGVVLAQGFLFARPMSPEELLVHPLLAQLG